jgi:methionyl aminopeptidase
MMRMPARSRRSRVITCPAAGAKFPFVLCTSVNEEIVHGMPSAKTGSEERGDIVSIDTGVQLDGYYGDSAITVPVGEMSEEAEALDEVTQESLELAIDKCGRATGCSIFAATVERT